MRPYQQLARYGGLSKSIPFIKNKLFFLVSSSESLINRLNDTYPVDENGVPRVYTSWASVITALQAEPDSVGYGCMVFVSAKFTTAPTASQLLALENAGATTIFESPLGDGTFFAKRATNTLPQTAAGNLFAVTGKLELIDIIGEVTTIVQAQANATKLQSVPTVGNTTDLCATSDINGIAVGEQLSITGTLANALVLTAGGAFVKQAAPLIILPGFIKLNCAASNTGSIKWHARYRPIDPGAFLIPQ